MANGQEITQINAMNQTALWIFIGSAFLDALSRIASLERNFRIVNQAGSGSAFQS